MFRRVESSLPPDPVFPTDLKELGFYINENDEIKNIEHPTDDYRFWITNNGRYNDVSREAMHTCIRNEVTKRMIALNVPPLYLPTLTMAPPPAPNPHLAIYCTPPHLLRTKKRIIVHINRSREDHGIHAYRVLSKSQHGTTKGGGVAHGSVVSLVNEVHARVGEQDDEDLPGMIVLNPGQLLFSHKLDKSLTLTSWDALARPSAVHPAPRIDEQWNKIEGNKTIEEHIRFVFDRIICDTDFVSPNTELYIVALGDGSDAMIDSLDKHWFSSSTNRNGNMSTSTPGGTFLTVPKENHHIVKNRPHIAALAMTAPTPMLPPTNLYNHLPSDRVLAFLATKARIWALSHHPLDTPLANPDPIEHVRAWRITSDTSADESKNGNVEQKDNIGLPVKEVIPPPRPAEVTLAATVSGGADDFAECVMPAAYGAILDWFEEVAAAGVLYEHPEMNVSEDVLKDRREWDSKVRAEWRDEPWGGEGGDGMSDFGGDDRMVEVTGDESNGDGVVEVSGITDGKH